MEFLRFGSSIPGSYWGCCAVCIIQNFQFDPDEKASIQIVDGDGGLPLKREDKDLFAGPTYRDIFLQRLRFGTFGSRDMPNHVFLAVLTDSQIKNKYGKAWLKLLKEQGFEFIRTTDNSVYTGSAVLNQPTSFTPTSHKNYIFGLFRNIGMGAIEDPFTPPKEWTDLEKTVPEAWEFLTEKRKELTKEIQEAQLKLWDALPPTKLLTEEELEAQEVPVIYAGVRSNFPQQKKSARLRTQETLSKDTKAVASPFSITEPYDEEVAF